jgi:hypothetical protein
VPALLPGDPGDDIPILALADHEGGLKRFIGFEIPDGGKKLLMPDAEKNPAAPPQMAHPGLFILDGHTERPGVQSDHPTQKGLDLPGDGIPIFFEHQNPFAFLGCCPVAVITFRLAESLLRVRRDVMRLMDKTSIRQGENRFLHRHLD